MINLYIYLCSSEVKFGFIRNGIKQNELDFMAFDIRRASTGSNLSLIHRLYWIQNCVKKDYLDIGLLIDCSFSSSVIQRVIKKSMCFSVVVWKMVQKFGLMKFVGEFRVNIDELLKCYRSKNEQFVLAYLVEFLAKKTNISKFFANCSICFQV